MTMPFDSRNIPGGRQERETRRRLLRTLGFAAALVLGLAAALGNVATAHDLGGAVALIGGAGLLWSMRQTRQERQEAQRLRSANAQREALRTARRERETRERARRLRQRQLKAAGAARQEAMRTLQRQARQERVREEAARRAEREDALLAEADRLRALSDEDLAAETARIFVQRGFRTLPPEGDAGCDLALLATDSELEAARCVPAGRIATGTDVQALETWRQAAGARHAYLVAPAGFAPSAVRQVRDLPITLVEAHLLAHWRQTARFAGP